MQRAAEAGRYDLGARQVVPPELGRFFGPGLSRTLTIRGPPGSGKTTLSLALLHAFPGYRAFVSGRVTRNSLLREHPWIGQPGSPPIDLVEDLRFRGAEGSGAISVGSLRDTLEARANDLVELSSVLALPPDLARAIDSHRKDPKLVVIDSWEAWVENTLGPTPLAMDVPTTRWELERSLLDRFLDAGVHLVLIGERNEPARLDYVTDGALTLSLADREGRAERWLVYQKLRGTRMNSLSYPFTLEGGVFRAIEPAQARPAPGPIPFQPDPGSNHPGAWPGSEDFATRFGRLASPGPTLLEVDAETPLRLLWRMTVPILISALRSGGRVLLQPPSTLSVNALGQEMLLHLPAEVLRSKFLLLSPDLVPMSSPFSPGEGAGTSPEPLSPPSLERFLFPEHPSPPGEVGVHSVMVLFPEHTIDPGSRWGTQPLARLLELANRAGEGLSIVLFSRSTSGLIERLRSRALSHLLVHSERGQYFLTGIRPWSPHFALGLPIGRDQDLLPYDFVPVV